MTNMCPWWGDPRVMRIWFQICNTDFQNIPQIFNIQSWCKTDFSCTFLAYFKYFSINIFHDIFLCQAIYFIEIEIEVNMNASTFDSRPSNSKNPKNWKQFWKKYFLPNSRSPLTVQFSNSGFTPLNMFWRISKRWENSEALFFLNSFW